MSARSTDTSPISLPSQASPGTPLSHPAFEMHSAIVIHKETLEIDLQKIKFGIFDFDRTILNVEPAHIESIRATGECGLLPPSLSCFTDTINPRFLGECFNVPEATSFGKIIGIIADHCENGGELDKFELSVLRGIDPAYLVAIRAEFFESLTTGPRFKTELSIPDGHTLSIIERLNEGGCGVSICTGSGSRVVTACLKAYNIQDKFSLKASVFANELPAERGKPNADPYELSLTKLCIKGEERAKVIAFEDSVSGALSAYRAGLSVILRPSDDYDATLRKLSILLKDFEPPRFGSHTPTIHVVRTFEQVNVVNSGAE